MTGALCEVRVAAVGLDVRVRSLEAQLAQCHREIASLAREDAETGLAHRRELERLLHAEVARSNRYGRSLAIVLVELEGAEEVSTLAIAATVIVGSIRVTDQAARYSARCFAVVLPETDDAGAQVVGARLRAAVPCALGNSVGVRVGTSSIPEDGQTVDALLRAAREALSPPGSH